MTTPHPDDPAARPASAGSAEPVDSDAPSPDVRAGDAGVTDGTSAADDATAPSATPPVEHTPEPSSWETEASGAHRQVRPVPRAGLSETHSAGHLTGASPAEPAESSWQPYAEHATQPVPPTDPTSSPAAPSPEPPTQHLGHGPYDTGRQAPVPHDGTGPPATASLAAPGGEPAGYAHGGAPAGYATEPYHHEGDVRAAEHYPEEVPPRRSRVLAHILSLLLTLVLAPVTLLAFGAVQLKLMRHFSMTAGTEGFDLAALAAFLGTALLVVIIAILARWSSLGALVTGTIMLLAGLAVLVVPSLLTADWMLTTFDSLGRAGGLALDEAARTATVIGQLAMAGLVLLLLGVVSHSARRAGHREGRDGLRREQIVR